MKILITGSEGSLMQAVIPKLLDYGDTVIGVDNLLRHGKRLDSIITSPYVWYNIDLADRKAVDDLMEEHKPDYIIQAAARIYGIGGFNKYGADILGEDLALHNNVLRAAVKNNVKKVAYISSSMVYEGCPQSVDIPVWEKMPDYFPAPSTEYGLSKFVGERMCKAFHKEYGLEYVIWRPFNIITPYEKAEGDIGISHVFADFIDNIVIKKVNPLPIIGDGNQIRCFTWIDEVATAIANYSFEPYTDGETFNLGNPNPITMRTLAEKIHHIATSTEFGIPLENLEFQTTKSFPHDVTVRIPCMEHTENILKWKAKVDVDSSIRKCLEFALEKA